MGADDFLMATFTARILMHCFDICISQQVHQSFVTNVVQHSYEKHPNFVLNVAPSGLV